MLAFTSSGLSRRRRFNIKVSFDVQPIGCCPARTVLDHARIRKTSNYFRLHFQERIRIRVSGTIKRRTPVSRMRPRKDTNSPRLKTAETWYDRSIAIASSARNTNNAFTVDLSSSLSKFHIKNAFSLVNASARFKQTIILRFRPRKSRAIHDALELFNYEAIIRKLLLRTSEIPPDYVPTYNRIPLSTN